MKNPHEKATRALETRTDHRIREAAIRSRDTPPLEICRQLGISRRTLKRYERDPRWEEYGGVALPRYFTKAGRPRRDPDTDKELITEAYRLRSQGEKWKDIADALDLTIDQLDYLRRKYPA